MQILKKMLKQDAVYWPPSGRSDDQGNTIFDEPVEIKCRWEDVSEQFVTNEGRDAMSNAKVYSDRDLKVGGVLWLGLLQDVTSQTSPFENSGAYEIRKCGKIPTLKATKFLRENWL